MLALGLRSRNIMLNRHELGGGYSKYEGSIYCWCASVDSSNKWSR